MARRKSKRKPKQKESRARKTSSVPTLVLDLGLSWDRLPATTRKALQDEIFAGHMYQRDLTRIENECRQTRYEIRRSLSPQLIDLHTGLDEINAQLATLRSKLRPKAERKAPEQKALVKEIESLKSEVSKQYQRIHQEHEALDARLGLKALDEDWKKAKEERLAAAALAAGKTTLGPNDRTRHLVMSNLYAEYLASERPEAWRAQLAAYRRKEEATKRARKIASRTPPPGLVRLSPGTYQSIEAAVAQAAKDTIGPLKLKKFDGRGRVGIQLTDGKGATTADLLSGACERLSITVREDVRLRKSKSDVFYPSHSRKFDRHAEQRKARAELYARNPELRPYRARIAARMKLRGRTKDAVWLELEGTLHRRLPEDGVAKWAHVVVDRIGYQHQARLLLTIESRNASPERIRPGNAKKIALNLGWRVEGHRIQIATTWDGTESRAIYLEDEPRPNQKTALTMRAREEHKRLLLAHADTRFDGVVRLIREWLGRLPADEAERLRPHLIRALPRHVQRDDMTVGNITALMSRWRDHRKLTRLVSALCSCSDLTRETLADLWRKWKQPRLRHRPKKLDLFPETVGEIEELDQWLASEGVTDLGSVVAFYGFLWGEKERHLTNWARDLEEKLKRRKVDRYRKLAYRLAREYDQVAIEKWDKSKTAETPKYEEDDRTPQEERGNAVRHFAGVSAFANELRRRLRGDLVEQDARDITVEHFGCGGHAVPQVNPDKPGLSATPYLLCDRCSMTYDQGVNAARHLWDRAFGGRATPTDITPVGGERSGATPIAGGARRSSTPGHSVVDVEDAAE